ncbi:MAG: hypothetical protein ACOVNY_07855 [Chitinophagaceae bacterium]
MKPLIVLVSVFSIALVLIKVTTQAYNLQLSARIAMCAMLFFTAIGHFVFTKGMTMMVPAIIPYKTTIVYATGVLEILLGVSLLIPTVSACAGWLLIFFLILLLPANIYAAMQQVDYQKATLTGPGLTYLWFRIPLQIVFIVWVYLSAVTK